MHDSGVAKSLLPRHFAAAMTDTAAARQTAQNTTFAVLFAISFCHMLNDMMQALLPAIYPSLKQDFHLNFTQIGLITLVYQITASLLQPVVGYFSDLKPRPYSLATGMIFDLDRSCGALAIAGSYGVILVCAMLIGIGSAVFHPESSRVARMASGGRHGLAQSLFQVGGNTGSALGPLLAAALVARYGQHSIAWAGAAGAARHHRSFIMSAPGTSITAWPACGARARTRIIICRARR